MVTNLGVLQRWDLATGKPLFDAPADQSFMGPIEHLAFTANGKELFASSWSLQSARWDVGTGKPINMARQRFGHQLTATSGGLRSLDCDSYKKPAHVTVFDPIAGKAVQTIHWAGQGKGGHWFRACTVTTSGKMLLAIDEMADQAARKAYVIAVDVASGRELFRFGVPADNQPPWSPFSPCGRWVVLRGRVYNVGSGAELFTPRTDSGEQFSPGAGGPSGEGNGDNRAACFSGDSRLLAGRLLRKVGEKATAADTFAVWEVATGKLLARFSDATFVQEVAFAPDGRTIALVDGRGIRLYDLSTGRQLASYSAPDVTCELMAPGAAQTLVFAPDSRTLATGHRDGAVLLWKVPEPDQGVPQPISDVECDGLWADLGNDAPAKARSAKRRLAGDPATAVVLLTARFRPLASPADAAIAGLIKDLDSGIFTVREEATRKLREHGAKAEAALRRCLANRPSLEVRRRVEALVATIPPPSLRLPVTGDRLRGIRAIEVLERADTAQTWKLLQAWSEQTADIHLALEARTALERLSIRHGKTDSAN